MCVPAYGYHNKPILVSHSAAERTIFAACNRSLICSTANIEEEAFSSTINNVKCLWVGFINDKPLANNYIFSLSLFLHSEAVEDVHANTHATSMVKTMAKVSRTGNGVSPPTTVPAKSWQSGNTAGELKLESEWVKGRVTRVSQIQTLKLWPSWKSCIESNADHVNRWFFLALFAIKWISY